MVMTCLPATSPTVMEQDLTACLSTITVHAPHRPSPQPNFLPVPHDHSTRAAQALAAAELRAREAEVAAQHPQQGALVVHRDARGLAIEREGNRSLHEWNLRK